MKKKTDFLEKLLIPGLGQGKHNWARNSLPDSKDMCKEVMGIWLEDMDCRILY